MVCMLNPCANSDLLLGELNENAVEFSVSPERHPFLFFVFCFLYGVELPSKWMECLHAKYLKNQIGTCEVLRSNCGMLK